jgi:hypothetical protein
VSDTVGVDSLPSLHRLQIEEPVGEYHPAVHISHSSFATEFLAYPASHLAHWVSAVTAYPTSHKQSCSEVLPLETVLRPNIQTTQ